MWYIYTMKYYSAIRKNEKCHSYMHLFIDSPITPAEDSGRGCV